MTDSTSKDAPKVEEQAGAKAALEAEYGDIDRSFVDGVEIEPEADKPAEKKTSTTVKKES